MGCYNSDKLYVVVLDGYFVKEYIKGSTIYFTSNVEVAQKFTWEQLPGFGNYHKYNPKKFYIMFDYKHGTGPNASVGTYYFGHTKASGYLDTKHRDVRKFDTRAEAVACVHLAYEDEGNFNIRIVEE